jgi:hypothetical protein
MSPALRFVTLARVPLLLGSLSACTTSGSSSSISTFVSACGVCGSFSAACTSSAASTVSVALSCLDGRCEVALAGASSQTVALFDQVLIIGDIDDGSVSVTVAGEKKALSVGETVRADGLAIELVTAKRSIQQARLVITTAAI